MREQFPQFIETRAKLVGPLTFPQFLYLAAGGVIIFIIRFILPSILIVPVAIVVGAFAIALAFVNINGTSFADYVRFAFSFIFKRKRYLYSKDDVVLSQYYDEHLASAQKTYGQEE